MKCRNKKTRRIREELTKRDAGRMNRQEWEWEYEKNWDIERCNLRQNIKNNERDAGRLRKLQFD